MNIPYVFKRCTKCGKWLVANTYNFHKQNHGKYNLLGKCKTCSKKYYQDNKKHISDRTHKYYVENREHKLKYRKQWYQDNKDYVAEYHKQYKKNNKEIISTRNKNYYLKNKEHRIEYCKQWYQDNKDHVSEINKRYYLSPQGQAVAFNKNIKRRIKKQNQGDGITQDQWLEMMRYFNWKCAYSGKSLKDGTRSIDHIEPLNQGGEHEIWNVVPMYRPYNSSKKDKNLMEWYIKQKFYSETRLKKIKEWQKYAFEKYSVLKEVE